MRKRGVSPAVHAGGRLPVFGYFGVTAVFWCPGQARSARRLRRPWTPENGRDCEQLSQEGSAFLEQE